MKKTDGAELAKLVYALGELLTTMAPRSISRRIVFFDNPTSRPTAAGER